jgi:isochorismate hydrolase
MNIPHHYIPTGEKNIIITGLGRKSVSLEPTLDTFAEDYNIYVVEDCYGASSKGAHEAALRESNQRFTCDTRGCFVKPMCSC